MWLIIVVLAPICYYYYQYGVLYAKGCAEYCRLNNDGSDEAEDCWESIREEARELTKACRTLSLKNIILEFFDFVHAMLTYLITTYLPEVIYYHWVCWFIIFPLTLPSAVKLAKRYKLYRCIRNHQRPNWNHKCCFRISREILES